LAQSEDAWLPSTDTKTVRQKVQRAFAAEFLCPIDHLMTFLGDTGITEAALDDAADYFGVSPLAVRSHLENNGILPANYWADN
jgi:Zn-dependent peptidase ImmA (M78 family)